MYKLTRHHVTRFTTFRADSKYCWISKHKTLKEAEAEKKLVMINRPDAVVEINKVEK